MTNATVPRIVVGVDGSASAAQALDWAVRQAELTGASLDVIVTWHWPTTGGWGTPMPPTYSPVLDAEEILNNAVKPVREFHPSLDIVARVVERLPAPALVEASHGAALLVVGSRGHGELAGMLIGSVSERCATHASCPVLVFREAESLGAPRIVVGIDGSESSLGALDWAARQAELTGALLDVICTWEWLSTYGVGMPLPMGYEPSRETEDTLKAVLDPLRVRHPALQIQARALEGRPGPMLVDASHSADLVVVGSRGHGEWTGVLLGSVGEHCAAHAHCPVLVFRNG